jgi:hypothetical protein
MEESSEELKHNTLILKAEDLLMIVKALDVYAYSLYACGADEELAEIQTIVRKVISKIPKVELDS